MMEKLSMCRICLIKDVRLHCLVNTHLQEIYELLSGNLLETKDKRPLRACYMCCARLRNCLQLRTACLHSEELFSRLLEDNSWEVTPPQGMTMLQTKPVMNMCVSDLGPVGHWELQLDPIRTTDERQHEEHVGDLQDNITDQGICTQIIKSEDIKKKCNESISSVDLQDIYDKPVKIEVQQMDLSTFPKPATVTKHLNPTDLEYTSQWNQMSCSENVEMLRPNICEENKQIVHKPSETQCSENSDLFFKHILSQTKEKSFQCPLCGRCFTRNSDLTIHIRTHTGVKPYKCDTCGKSFTTEDELPDHTCTHTEEKPYKCDMCGKCYAQNSSLRIHIRTHTGVKPYNCDTCGKAFTTNGQLSEHTRTHTEEKPYKCDTCGKCYTQNSSLRIHIRTHTGVKPYKCDTCGKAFTTSGQLSEHTRIHTGEKPYKCKTCGKSFSQSHSLRIHIRKHTGEKPYECNTCGKFFNDKYNLSTHIRTHTGKKSYKCDSCGKCFPSKSSLSQHTVVTREKPRKSSLKKTA